jgi:hypothetical protein
VGISRDFNQALEWFLRAADAGNKDVYLTIATIYEKGSAGSSDLEKAYEWYQRAAEDGSEEAAEATQKGMYDNLHWKDNIYRLTGNRVRIKVIVYVESVYIISANNVLHHAANIVTALRDAWIHDELTIIRKHPLWMAYRHMVARKRFSGLCLCSIRVYPCMQFHSALVALLHHPCKRIPVWRWC